MKKKKRKKKEKAKEVYRCVDSVRTDSRKTCVLSFTLVRIKNCSTGALSRRVRAKKRKKTRNEVACARRLKTILRTRHFDWKERKRKKNTSIPVC